MTGSSGDRQALTDISKFTTPAALGSWDIRVVTIDGEPWFVARDVTNVLGIKTMPYAVRPLDADEKGAYPIHTPGGWQSVTTISKSGLYKLIMRSDKPIARQFQDWIAREVLPSIDKNGAYIAGQEDLRDGTMSPELLIAKALQAAQDIIGDEKGHIPVITLLYPQLERGRGPNTLGALAEAVCGACLCDPTAPRP